MRATLKLDVANNEFKLFTDPSMKEKCKSIHGRYWDFAERCWRYHADEATYVAIKQKFFGQLDEEGDVEHFLNHRQEEHKKLKEYQNLDKVVEEGLIELPSKTQAMKHQKVAMTLGKDKVGFGLFLEPGLGKTKVAVDMMGYYFDKYKYKTALVVAPLAVLSTWINELRTHASYDYHAEILEGTTSQKVEQLRNMPTNKPLIVITNYETLYRASDALTAVHFDIVIADEVHRARNARTQTNEALCEISRLAKVRLGLTGTPIGNSPLDVYGIYKFINPRIFGQSFVSFRDRYAIMGGFQKKQVVGYKNQDELSNRMYEIAYRCRKEEALELPDEVYVDVPVKLEKKTMELYSQLEEQTFFEVGGGDAVKADITLTFMLRGAQITSGFVKTVKGDTVQVSNAKLSVLEDLCSDLLEDPEKKIVIFTRFQPETIAIRDMLKKHKHNSYILDGSTPAKERGKLIDDFQSDNLKTRVFIINISAGGVGITLTRADTAIYYSQTFSYIDFEQSRARIYRHGQKKKVTYYSLIAEGTVDETIYKAVRAKESVSAKIVDRFRDRRKKA